MKSRAIIAMAFVVVALAAWGLIAKEKLDGARMQLDLYENRVEGLEMQVEFARKNIEKVADIDEKYALELSEIRSENDQLRLDVAAGAKRLYVNATCPTSVPGPAAAPGLDAGDRAELTRSSREAYLQLRVELGVAEQKILGLQEYVRSVCLNGGRDG